MSRNSHQAERTAPRHDAKMAAEVVVGGRTIHAHTRDISKGGVGLVTKVTLPESGAVEITLFLTKDGIEDPDHEPLQLVGAIQWTAEQDDGSSIGGVRFEKLSSAQEARLARFLFDLDDAAKRAERTS
jgi:c-di-GMP-binding flagellar brake protein YcgR